MISLFMNFLVIVYENHENKNNCQSKTQPHTIYYNKRNNIIKSDHQVLSGI